MEKQLDHIWTTKEIIREPVCFAEDGEGKITGGKLLYAPLKVDSVVSHDLTITYIEGEDYIVDGSFIRRTENSRIPILPRGEYCLPFAGEQEHAWLCVASGTEYICIFPPLYQYQVLVTYTHDDTWDGMIPPNEGAALSRTWKKLEKGGDFHLMFFGDSITSGYEASGADEYPISLRTGEEYHLDINRPPYQPSWPEQVTRGLRAAYPQANIIKINRAAAGSSTMWGVNNADKLVNPYTPDLMILAFGMNSLRDAPEVYREQIESIIATVRSKNPECDIVLVSPMTPNSEIVALSNNRLPEHEDALRAIAAEQSGIAVAPVHSICRTIVEHGKTLLEINGNCINHPNDFTVSVYGHTVLTVMGL